MTFDSIFTPLIIRTLTLKNRIIFAPTTLGLSDDAYLNKIQELAKGGCAMIIIGDVPVSPKGRYSLFSKKGQKHYEAICSIAHQYDCKVCAQLHQSDTVFPSMGKMLVQLLTKKMGKDDIRQYMNEQIPQLISTMPIENIHDIISQFAHSAIQAQKLGFDMVQVHGDRMCGSFSSSLFNHRKDEYGNSALGRTRFAVECVQAIRQALPNMPIDYKLVIRQENPHYGNAGVLFDEIGLFVNALEKAGVDSFHVTLANHSKLEDPIPPANHPYFKDEGCFLYLCDEVSKYTKRPICGVGKLSSPLFIDKQLRENRIALVGMSRQLIADANWVNKVFNQQIPSIQFCHYCNEACLKGMQKHQGVHCIYEGGK